VALKKILVATFVLLMAVFTVSAWAQMAPTPGPEVKKLDYFAGTWTTEATIGQGPWGAGGKFISTSTTEWMPGNFFIESHSDFKMPPELGGDGKGTAIAGYDTDSNVYTRDEFSSQGRRENATGTVTGDTWTWTSTQIYSGQEIKQKLTMKVLSPTSYNVKLEISMDGTTWMQKLLGQSDPAAIARTMTATILQGDASPAAAARLSGYLGGSGASALAALSPENADERVRGAAYLTMAMPAYQLA